MADESDPFKKMYRAMASIIIAVIENDKGMSVRIGRSFIREDGLRNIRITGNDLLGADDERQENISNRDT